jgi:bifunctional UDP-N-acetylglucosamine pyrophosphorylase/glucosamine-1-phosphate N-acetyltransferase/UDP-N-acetylglucosamine pyrophosphorylase
MDSPLAIVLAAGKGTRMKSDLPKVLCEANGRPLVHYVIDALRAGGVQKFVVVVGYRAELVEEALADEPQVRFALQSEQLGTGHAVMMCREAIKNHHGAVVVVAGDSPMLQPESIQLLLEEFQATRPACVLGSLIHPHPTGLGRIVRDLEGKFVGIVEHKDATPEQLAIQETNMSTYVFDCQKMLGALEQLTNHNQQREFYITDVPAILLRAGEDVRALPVLKPIEALSVNTVEHLADVEAAIRDRMAAKF